MKTKFKILFFHGFFASGNCALAHTLRETLQSIAEVDAPDLPLHPEEALQQMRTYCQKEQPDLLVGNSCGSFLAQIIAKETGIPALLGNPHLNMPSFLQDRIGLQTYKTPRQDGHQEMRIDESLIEEFATLVKTQFDGCRPEWRNRVWGLFGENDTIAHYEPMFAEHYPTVYHFPGGHAPTPEEVKEWYAPLAEKMLITGCKDDK